MPKKLGLLALVVAASVGVVTPAFADDPPDASTETTEVETSTGASTDPSSTTATTAPAPSSTDGSETSTATTVLGPVVAELGPIFGSLDTPGRGTQLQLTPPPPPPPTLPAWAILPANSGSGRRVVYSKSQQAVWALDANNNIIKFHRVSGKQTPLDPRPGVYSVWSRSLHTNSIANPSITWMYMVRFAKGANGGNIGFHEIPWQYGRRVQTEAQLGQPLSGGCVRQAVSDAIWMWNWAGLGTVVVVLP